MTAPEHSLSDTRLTATREAQIHAAIADATPGPWYTRPEVDGVNADRQTVVYAFADHPSGRRVARRIATVGQTRPHFNGPEAERNIALIAAAPGIINELLAEITQLRSDALQPTAHRGAATGAVLAG